MIVSKWDLSSNVGIEVAESLITNSLRHASDICIPSHTPNKSGMKKLSPAAVTYLKKCKTSFAKWKDAGKPPKDHPLSRTMVNNKRVLRRQLRREEARKRADLQEAIMSTSTSDTKLFFQLINRQRKTVDQETSTLSFNDTIYDGPEEVCNGFAKYFKELGQPRVSNNFYESHKIMVEVDMAVLEGSSTSDAGEDEWIIVSNQEVQDALDRLKPGKAMDKDSIAGEHLIYAKDVLVEPLVKFFNAIFKQCHIPSSFLEGTIKPIWKKKGSKDDPTKYRGITITSTLGKVDRARKTMYSLLGTALHDVLTKKIEPFFLDTQSKLQFGFTSNTSILAATLLLNEVLTRERSRPKLTAIYLDAEKAFDMVWQQDLLTCMKLALLGIPKDLWSILMNVAGKGRHQKLSRFTRVLAGW